MLKAEVRLVLERLNAPSLMERTRAEERLIALGPEVLPLLPAPELVSAVSAKQALKRVRIQLETIAARQSVMPSKLTLRGTYSVSEISKKIELQTRNRLILSDPKVADSSRLFDVDWSERPFWDAMADLERQQLSIEFSPKHSAYVWTKSSPQQQTVQATLGSFRMTAPPIHARSAPQNLGRLLHVGVSISAEPRLRPLLLRYSAADFSLGDDDSIEPFDPDSKIEVPIGDGGRVSHLNLPFKDSKKNPQTRNDSESLNLKGRVQLVVAAGEIPIEFKEFGRTQGISRRYGGVSVSLEKVRLKKTPLNNVTASVRLQVSYDSPQHTFESHQLWVFHNRVFLKAPNGQEVSHTGAIETLYQHDGIVGVEYLFENLPEESRNWSCYYIAPTLLVEVPLEFMLLAVPIKPNP